MNLPKVQRLLKLIGLLQGSGYTTQDLADTCEVSRRTIFRDLETLRDSGLPLTYDQEKGRYYIPHVYFLPPTNFTPQEALAVLLLCHEMGDHRGVPFCSAARSAAVKLENRLPARMLELVREVTGSVHIQVRASRDSLADRQPIYDQLLEAIAARRCVRIDYDSFTEDEVICTRLSPYELLFSGHSWYIIGRSSLHRSVRTFNVGRIHKLTRLDDTFQPPANFSLDHYLKNAWHLIPEPGPDYDVEILFRKMVARNVAEVAWHKTQRVEFREDGSMIFRATVSGLNEVFWWILGYGDQAEVLHPAELRDMIAQSARQMLRQYDGK